VGKINVHDFIKEQLGEKKGGIVNEKGKQIGEHNGTWFFTLGQRKGIGLSGGPYYVTDIDRENNIVTVAHGEGNKKIFKKSIQIAEPHWSSGTKPHLPLELDVATRYTHTYAKAKLHIVKNNYRITFRRKQRAPTPGQCAVVYKNAECIGGAFID